jgi:hypothetical protein
MTVVNHFYLTYKCFGRSWKHRLFWAWSEIGLIIVALLWVMAGRGPTRLLGIFDGYRELLALAVQRYSARHQIVKA